MNNSGVEDPDFLLISFLVSRLTNDKNCRGSETPNARGISKESISMYMCFSGACYSCEPFILHGGLLLSTEIIRISDV